jgi:hypothetical protein
MNDCLEFHNANHCEPKVTSKFGISCVWAKVDLSVNECVSEHSVECVNFVSFSGCTWSKSAVACMWNGTQCANAENCTTVELEGPCSMFSSSKGKCFYNGKTISDTSQRPCSDITDVTDCGELLSLDLCMETFSDYYPNLSGPSSKLSICIWNVDKSTCERKNANNDGSKDNNNEGNSLIMIVIIIVVAQVIIIIVIIIIVILFRRRSKSKQKESEELKKSLEMNSLKSIGNSLPSSSEYQRKASLRDFFEKELKKIKFIFLF